MVRPIGRPMARKSVALEDLREEFLADCEARNLGGRTVEWNGNRARRFTDRCASQRRHSTWQLLRSGGQSGWAARRVFRELMKHQPRAYRLEPRILSARRDHGPGVRSRHSRLGASGTPCPRVAGNNHARAARSVSEPQETHTRAHTRQRDQGPGPDRSLQLIDANSAINDGGSVLAGSNTRAPSPEKRPQQTDGHAGHEVADAVHKPHEAERPAADRLGQELGRVAALRRFDERRRRPTATNNSASTRMEVGGNTKAVKRGRTA